MVYYTSIKTERHHSVNGGDLNQITNLSSNNQNDTQLYNVSSSNMTDPNGLGDSPKTMITLTNVTRPQQQSSQQQQQQIAPITTTTTNSSTKQQFKCDQCNMFFGSKSAHTSHMKSHAKTNGTRANGANGTATNSSDPYQCDVCKKTFAVPARLVRHYRTHTGERPFECEFCHKMFSVKENLQVHRRIHTKERPYKCDRCGRAFEHSGKLHRHMRIHTGLFRCFLFIENSLFKFSQVYVQCFSFKCFLFVQENDLINALCAQRHSSSRANSLSTCEHTQVRTQT